MHKRVDGTDRQKSGFNPPTAATIYSPRISRLFLRTISSIWYHLQFRIACYMCRHLWEGRHNERPGFDFRHYQIFWLLVDLERRPLSLVTIDELIGRKSNSSGLESLEYGCRNPSRWPRGTLYPQKLVLTSPTSGGRSVGIIRSRTEATEFS
jgi:hypothetical protein